MYIDPQIDAFLRSLDPTAPDFPELSVAEARAAMSAGSENMREPIAIAEVRDISIPGPAGAIGARVYRADTAGAAPLTVFIHGGGWMVGNLDDYDRQLRRLAVDAGSTVLSVDYRLAPEQRFPAALDDAYAAVAWADRHRAEIGAAEGFLAVAGDSSGGNLAGAVAQRARDEQGPRIDHQLLIYPVVRRTFDTGSYRDFASGYLLTRAAMEYFWDSYVGDQAGRPRYADLLAHDLRDLPEATIIACSLDPLRDENAEYAAALADAGVATTFQLVYGLVHGSWMKDGVSQRAYELGVEIAAALRRAHARAG